MSSHHVVAPPGRRVGRQSVVTVGNWVGMSRAPTLGSLAPAWRALWVEWVSESMAKRNVADETHLRAACSSAVRPVGSGAASLETEGFVGCRSLARVYAAA